LIREGSGFALLHEDAAFLVLDKPAGLLCVPGRGAEKQDCLSARVQANFPDALIVHRLDMATSGLVLMARGTDNQRCLSAAFEARGIDKTYLAWVGGNLERDLAAEDATANGWHTIDLPIGADWPNRPRQKIDSTGGKQSLTRWRCTSAAGPNPFSDCSRIELEPLTGRTHQLRVHMAAIGHPILGDALYASGAVCAGADRLMLHAAQLVFSHPVTGKRLQYDSPAPF
jgi:tRNA pseudouridine32 synthase / 23S rRNA pseudouridine746 synthase